MNLAEAKIAIIGLGYVGLPLAVEFWQESFGSWALDINEGRISELLNGHDSTLEVSDDELKAAVGLSYSSDVKDVADCNVYICYCANPH